MGTDRLKIRPATDFLETLIKKNQSILSFWELEQMNHLIEQIPLTQES